MTLMQCSCNLKKHETQYQKWVKWSTVSVQLHVMPPHQADCQWRGMVWVGWGTRENPSGSGLQQVHPVASVLPTHRPHDILTQLVKRYSIRPVVANGAIANRP